MKKDQRFSVVVKYDTGIEGVVPVAEHDDFKEGTDRGQSFYRLGQVNPWKDMYDQAQPGNFRIKAFTKDLDTPFETPFITSKVMQEGSSYTVVSSLTGIYGPCEVIVAGYKEDKFITLNHSPYNGEETRLVLNGDIDTIKVMVWNSTGSAVPLCKCKVITSW